MTLKNIMELQQILLEWNKDKVCGGSDLIDCRLCPFDKNEICERLQQICIELENK